MGSRDARMLPRKKAPNPAKIRGLLHTAPNRRLPDPSSDQSPEAAAEIFFFHPDFTVGPGLSPSQP